MSRNDCRQSSDVSLWDDSRLKNFKFVNVSRDKHIRILRLDTRYDKSKYTVQLITHV
jgi:hypothetical protein